jgi:NAD(P)-dependent dehydrogenase (short-subunit alcohol dehydrogenase family)
MARVATVSGGAGAIGGAIATALRTTGHTVAVLDRAGDPPVDLAQHDDVKTAATRILQAHGRCDVLVHAAAAFDRAPLSELDHETWRRVQAINVESALWLAQAFAPGMAERGFGRIVLVVSDTVWDPPAPDLLAYVASKAALIGVARTLARALGPDGITVNCVAPGLTPTPAAVADTPAEAFAQVQARQAIDRALTPEDVAATVAFLAGDAAGAITGQTLCVDGGLVLR